MPNTAKLPFLSRKYISFSRIDVLDPFILYV